MNRVYFRDDSFKLTPPSAATLCITIRDVLHYNPDTGIFVWVKRKSRRDCLGKRAGGKSLDGYTYIVVRGRKYRAHRLAWLYMTGDWPPHQIDHINGDRADNRFANLRPATHEQNQANSKKPVTNTSGFKGVHWKAGHKKWVASIHINGRPKYLGARDTAAEAHELYRAAAIKLHGTFARFE